MTYLLAITEMPNQFMCVDRYAGKNFVKEMHLKLAENDTVEALKDFLEVFRQTGATGS